MPGTILTIYMYCNSTLLNCSEIGTTVTLIGRQGSEAFKLLNDNMQWDKGSRLPGSKTTILTNMLPWKIKDSLKLLCTGLDSKTVWIPWDWMKRDWNRKLFFLHAGRYLRKPGFGLRLWPCHSLAVLPWGNCPHWVLLNEPVENFLRFFQI